MAGQFIRLIKYGILAVIAFIGPKMLTESGNYFAKMERTLPQTRQEETNGEPVDSDIDSPSFFEGLLHPTEAPVENSAYSAHYAPPPDVSNDAKAAEEVARGIPITPLEKILRFDLTPETIRQTWPIVYTDPSLSDLIGWRVSVLTGTAADDLAGALTYYFDRNRMNRIIFIGRTGDPKRIIDFLGYRYGTIFQRDESNGQTEIYRVPSAEGKSRKKGLSRLTIQRGMTNEIGSEVRFELHADD